MLILLTWATSKQLLRSYSWLHSYLRYGGSTKDRANGLNWILSMPLTRTGTPITQIGHDDRQAIQLLHLAWSPAMTSECRQTNVNHEEAAGKSATARYLRRERQVPRSQLNGQNKIRAINTYALPVIRYPAGTINWPKAQIEAIEAKTRKPFTMHGGGVTKSSFIKGELCHLHWNEDISFKRELKKKISYESNCGFLYPKPDLVPGTKKVVSSQALYAE